MDNVIIFPLAERRVAVAREREVAGLMAEVESLMANGGRVSMPDFEAKLDRLKELGAMAEIVGLLDRVKSGEFAKAAPDPEPMDEREKNAIEMGYHRGNGFKGSRYEETRNLDVKDIAKMLRKDIKAAVKAGKFPKGMKTSVRISRYSGGCSIDVTVKALPESFPLLNPEWVRFMRDNPNKPMPYGLAIFTDEAGALKESLESMMNTYNRDNSDTMTDYFDVRFYGHADFDWELRNSFENRMKEVV